jgi:hypothetical protein
MESIQGESAVRVTNKPDRTRVIALNLRMDLDAYELLRQLSPGPKTHGRFLARLIYEHQARQDERARMLQQQAVVNE